MSRVEIEAVMPEGDFFGGEGAVVIGGDNLTSPGWNLTREKAFSHCEKNCFKIVAVSIF